LLASLRESRFLAGRRVAYNLATLSGKRPDIVLLGSCEKVIIIEIKTRYRTLERRRAWEKYHSSCDLLFLAYPAANAPPACHIPFWNAHHPSFIFCGLIICDGQNARIVKQPTPAKPNPQHRAHLLRSLMRETGS
jgi:hypothetical protein